MSTAPLRTHPDAPLQIHARSTRIEILAALGLHHGAKIPAWQSRVYEAKNANAELFAFTLDESGGSFSPTTRYRDHAISRTLIHGESQSITRADSATGLRYRNRERDGRTIPLFTRQRTDDRAFWFLGPATYQGHVGERPDGHHLGAAPSALWRPLPVLRRSRRVATSPPRSADRRYQHFRADPVAPEGDLYP